MTSTPATSTPATSKPTTLASRIVLMVSACCALACGDPEREAVPPTGTVSSSEPSASDVDWPASPDGLADEVATCVEDYRRIGTVGLPARIDGEAFSAWYAGSFQTWTQAYNTVRERCDRISDELEPETAPAQVIFAAQSYMHERVGDEAEAYDEAPQMFIMARYWTLGAACTYRSCEAGIDPAWTRFCRERAQSLPACPPVEEVPTE